MSYDYDYYRYWDQGWEHLVKSEAFQNDASAVAKTSNEDLGKVAEALDGADGFLGPEALREVVGSVIEDRAQARGIASFIFNMYRLRQRHGDSFLANFERDLREHAPDSLKRAKFVAVLPRLLQKRAPIDRHTKADTLSDRVGGSLHSFSITCDLRPVFDDKREVLEGMFPVALLKVDTMEAYKPKSILVKLTAKELDRIVTEATNAQKKVAALKTLLAEHNIRIPEAGVRAEASVNADETEEDDV
jgi:hypothetical protein